jgi:hypothetical protein
MYRIHFSNGPPAGLKLACNISSQQVDTFYRNVGHLVHPKDEVNEADVFVAGSVRTMPLQQLHLLRVVEVPTFFEAVQR